MLIIAHLLPKTFFFQSISRKYTQKRARMQAVFAKKTRILATKNAKEHKEEFYPQISQIGHSLHFPQAGTSKLAVVSSSLSPVGRFLRRLLKEEK